MDQPSEWFPAAVDSLMRFGGWLAGFAPHPYWVFFCGVGLIALYLWRRGRKR